MSSWDITRLSPVERIYEVANRFGSNSDQFTLASTGLDRLRQKEKHRQRLVRSNRSNKFVVEKVIRRQIDGQEVEHHLYLSKEMVAGTARRAWDSADNVRVFSGERDAERALLLIDDPDARVIPHAAMVDRIAQLAGEKSR